MKDNKVYIERTGAYDGWLARKYEGDDKEYYRLDNSLILDKVQIGYGPVYFHTETGYYKNLKIITKEQYELNINKTMG